MTLLSEVKKYRVDTEESAIALIQKFRTEAATGGYEMKKGEYVMRTKKNKGEVIDLWYVVTVTLFYEE